MKPRVTVDRATSPDGTELQLVEHDGAYVINAELLRTREAACETVACPDVHVDCSCPYFGPWPTPTCVDGQCVGVEVPE